jgi:hypothetical protein
MRVEVRVHPGSGREEVRGPPYEIWVKKRAVENQANLAVIEVLSKHFGVPKSSVMLVRGGRSKIKVFEVNI